MFAKGDLYASKEPEKEYHFVSAMFYIRRQIGRFSTAKFHALHCIPYLLIRA